MSLLAVDEKAELELTSRCTRTDMINLTMIGTAIFVSMDLPDICLAVRRVNLREIWS